MFIQRRERRTAARRRSGKIIWEQEQRREQKRGQEQDKEQRKELVWERAQARKREQRPARKP